MVRNRVVRLISVMVMFLSSLQAKLLVKEKKQMVTPKSDYKVGKSITKVGKK